MKVRDLVSGTPATVLGPDTADVANIIIDSSKVTSDCVFVAIKGIARDGHDYLGDAAARGARVLVVEDAARVPAGFAGAVVVVPHGRAAPSRPPSICLIRRSFARSLGGPPWTFR